MIDIRLMLLPEDKEKALENLAKVFEIISVSSSYSNRNDSKLIRVYIKAKAKTIYSEYMLESTDDSRVFSPVLRHCVLATKVQEYGKVLKEYNHDVNYKKRYVTDFLDISEEELDKDAQKELKGGVK